MKHPLCSFHIYSIGSAWLKTPLLIVTIMFLFRGNLFSADRQITFRNLTIENGLSQSTILSIIQDREGYIWIGTANGLNKYDGYSITVYTNLEDDTSSISDNLISCIYEDRNGYIWLGTAEGILNRFDRRTEKFKRYYLNMADASRSSKEDNFYNYPIIFSRNNDRTITSITGDGKGNLWIGTWGCGIIRFNSNSGSQERIVHNPLNQNSPSYDRIKTIFADSKSRIWVGTFGRGIDLIEEKNGRRHFRHFTKDVNDIESISNNIATSVCEDAHHNIWIGTYGGGINKAVENSSTSSNAGIRFFRYFSEKTKGGKDGDVVMAITGDREGCVWIGTFGNGLKRYNPLTGNVSVFKHDPLNENSLGDDKVISLCEDKSGIIWAGTFLGKGVSIVQNSLTKFNTLRAGPSSESSLNDNIVWSVYEDKKGYLWIGTNSGGLNKVELKSRKIVYYKNIPGSSGSLSGNHVRAIAEDKWGNLWIGTYSSGLNVFIRNKGIFKSFRHVKGKQSVLPSDQIQSLYIDSSSVLWIGTFGGGLCKAELGPASPEKGIKIYSYAGKGFNDKRIYKVFEDKSGVFWICTFGGVTRLNPGTGETKNFVSDPSVKNCISDNRVLTAYEDGSGTLWFGTYGGGLNKFDRASESFSRYSGFEGVRADIIYGILEDTESYLWLSTDNGLIRFKPGNKHFQHFNLSDGLQSMEFSGGAYYKNKNGEMFFGGINGLNYFYPDSIRNNTFVPPVAITSFKIFNVPLKGEHTGYTIPFDKNFFSFEFAALDYTNPMDNHFAYMLEGFDSGWHYTDSRSRYAGYMNLNPGEYTFRVKGSNNDGVWNEIGASIKLTVLPPFWKTWWFILFSIILLVGAISSLIYLKVKSLLSIERIKTKLAADLHDNIGAGLTEISILNELVISELKEVPSSVLNKMKSVSEISRQLVDAMSDIVWVINPKRDSLYDLILRLKDSYSDFLSYIGISFKTCNMEVLDNIKLPMEFRQNLYLIFKEGINNSVKHSNCRKIVLDAKLKGKVLEIILRDDGSGLTEGRRSLGNGLQIMQNRAKSIGGRVTVDSEPSKGTSIHFIGRVDRAAARKRWYFKQKA